jgi:uncharacterized protein (DUF1778 family)
MKTIRKDQVLKLSVEDSEALIEALLNPPDPNDALKVAFSTYEKDYDVELTAK